MSIYNQHGGNLDAIEREYGISKEKIRDFSGNVNPLGPPKAVLDAIAQNAMLITRYPDISYLKLRESISRYTDVQPEHIITGNGSTELIALFIRTLCPQKSIVVAPAYSEYERELQLINCETILFPLNEDEDFQLNLDALEAVLDKSVQLLILCNPNNPTGAAITNTQLERLLRYAAESGIRVMVDETYAEFSDENVISTGLISAYPNLFTVRGTSKFFAVPGLRLGYAMCGDIAMLNSIHEKKDPWSVSILSATAGEAMFDDIEYIKQTKSLISSQREYFYKELSNIRGLHFYRSQSNFILVKLSKPKAPIITDELLKKNMLLRNAASFPFLDEHHLRFCILLPEHNQELIAELKTLM